MKNLKNFAGILIVFTIIGIFIFNTVLGINPFAGINSKLKDIDWAQLASTTWIKTKKLFSVGNGYKYGYIGEKQNFQINPLISEEDLEEMSQEYVDSITEEFAGMTMDDMMGMLNNLP